MEIWKRCFRLFTRLDGVHKYRMSGNELSCNFYLATSRRVQNTADKNTSKIHMYLSGVERNELNSLFANAGKANAAL